jgi:hypothetical protein
MPLADRTRVDSSRPSRDECLVTAETGDVAGGVSGSLGDSYSGLI